MNARFVLSPLVLLLFLVHPCWAEPPELIPAKTHAVIVGVLKWKDSRLGTYSPEKRKDQELYDALRELGVPEDNLTLLLDEAGTLEAMRKSLAAMAAKAGKEDTLIFYYAGHGMPSGSKIYFANYDVAGDMAKTAFGVGEVAEILTSKSKRAGGRVLLFADCCFSGALGDAAEELNKAGFAAASLTSATDSIPSTSNWTFTHALVDALRGRPLADRNRDGFVSLSDAAEEITEAMLFSDRQTAGYTRAGLAEEFIFAPARGVLPAFKDGPFAVGQYVVGRAGESERSPGRIVAKEGDAYRVEFQQYNDRRSVLLEASALEAVDRTTFLAKSGSAGAPEALPEEEALAKAAVDGKYRRLLRKIRVETDWRFYTGFRDYGAYPATSYGGYDDLPAGYWVYVYPHWYIWAERSDMAEGAELPPAAVPVAPEADPFAPYEPAPVAAPAAPPIPLEKPAIPIEPIPVEPIPVPAEPPPAETPAPKRSYGPEQATGAPDAGSDSDSGNAWCPATADDQDEWLELEYATAVIPVSVLVYENYSTGALVKVSGFTASGMEAELWAGDDPVSRSSGRAIAKADCEVKLKTKRIRIEIKSSKVDSWNEIDTVGIVDADGKTHWPIKARASSSYAGGEVPAPYAIR